MSTRVWPWVVGSVAGGVLLVGVYVKLFEDRAGPWSCDRGLRARDWKSADRSARIRTGRAVAKCGWVDGWTRKEVVARLGAPDGGTRKGFMSYQLGPCDCGIGPTDWFLVLRLSPPVGGVVVAARAEPLGV